MRWLFALALLPVLFWVALVAAIYLYGARDEARPAGAIVVLGAAQWNGRPSPVLKARMDHAIGLHREGVAPVIITTGGVGARDTVSEATVAKRYAVEQGVSADAVFTETSGLRTVQSMRTVVKMMERLGIDSAILVSDPFHMLRLKVLCMRLEPDFHSSPTRTSPISDDLETRWRHILRESFVIPVAFFES
ncbi:MAG: YdcF family protein [Longimicrobiaceae bacterium]